MGDLQQFPFIYEKLEFENEKEILKIMLIKVLKVLLIHIDILLDRFLGCAPLLSPTETLYGTRDKLQQLYEDEFLRENHS